MQEKPKEPIDESKRPPEKDGTWEDDQNKRGYYYDDAHGYEPYVEELPEDNDAHDTESFDAEART